MLVFCRQDKYRKSFLFWVSSRTFLFKGKRQVEQACHRQAVNSGSGADAELRSSMETGKEWRMSNDECRVTNVEWRMTNDEWRMSSDEWRTTNAELRMSSDECRTTNVEWRMSSDEWRCRRCGHGSKPAGQHRGWLHRRKVKTRRRWYIITVIRQWVPSAARWLPWSVSST